MNLKPEQVANYRATFPEMQFWSDAAIEKWATLLQEEIDARDTCDVLTDGTRCSVPRQKHHNQDHPFMEGTEDPR